MKLIVQPDMGAVPILTAIKSARKSIDLLIFRLDRKEIARALEAAVVRGVRVRALTAHHNHGGNKSLRELEMQLLAGGVTVSRTADDLVRYHGKLMIIDSRLLHVYGFNFTGIDLNKSRSFGIVTRNQKLLVEAMKLFAADFDRQPYLPGSKRLVVSPENARERLTAFLKGARRQLLIYDPHLSDGGMLKIIGARMRAGVEVKVIGKAEAKWNIESQKYPGKRLHVRAIIRDGQSAFVGSQSLRRVELERRREVGVIVSDRTVVRQLQRVFEDDWALTDSGRKELKRSVNLESSDSQPATADL